MARNKIADLNNHLFEQLERLNSDELKGDALKEEVERAKAIAQIATQIVNGQKMVVDAMRIVAKGDVRREDLSGIIDQKQISY